MAAVTTNVTVCSEGQVIDHEDTKTQRESLLDEVENVATTIVDVARAVPAVVGLGLLVNFAVPLIKPGINRIAFFVSL